MEYCLFQGTFNPVHNAHIRVAEYVLKTFGIDKVIFIPSFIPPHKDPNIVDAHHRLNMVKLTTRYNDKFEVSDIEIKRGGISYTYLTILELSKILKPESRLKFIIGTDAFKQIETWYETEKLKTMLDFIVFIREDNFDETSIEYLKEKGYNYQIMKLDYKDISSTEIREKIKYNQSVADLISKETEEYIKKYELYKN